VTTSLTAVRTDLYDNLAALEVAQVYKRRATNYEFPAFIVGWPQEVDFSAAMGSPRDFVVDVFVEVEVTDEDSADETLEELIEAAVASLMTIDTYHVRPATDFAESQTADGRTLIGCRLPVSVFE
jgi:DNA-binding Lrp family transcriptional regulator